MLSDAVHRALEALDDWARNALQQDALLLTHDRLVSALEEAIRRTMVPHNEEGVSDQRH